MCNKEQGALGQSTERSTSYCENTLCSHNGRPASLNDYKNSRWAAVDRAVSRAVDRLANLGSDLP